MIELLNNFGHAWAAYFGPVLLQNSIFLGLIFILFYIFRNASARFKYSIGIIGLIKLLIPPFIPLSGSSFSPAGSQYFSIDEILVDTGNLVLNNKIAVSSTGIAPDIFGLLFVIWISVAIFYLLFTFFSTLRLFFILKNADQLNFNDLEHLEIYTGIKIFKSDSISMPVTIGVFPKKIFVPATWELWTDECKNMVIQHELAHIKRYDNFTQILQILSQALYFFHPLVLILNRQLKEFREMACDDLAVEQNHKSRLSFSKYLVEIAETAVKNPIGCESVSALIRHKNGLMKRVKYQIREVTTMLRLSKIKKTGIIISLMLFVLPFSFYMSTKEVPVLSKADSYEIIELYVTANDEIRVNETKTTMEKLHATILQKAKSEKDDIVVAISGEKNLTMNQIFKVHQILRETGILKVAYIKSSGEKVDLILPPPENEEILKQISEKNLVTLQVTADDNVMVNKISFKTSDIETIVKKHLVENEHIIFIIQGDSKTTFENFLDILEHVKKGGARKIVVN